jgi:hypothetical protein
MKRLPWITALLLIERFYSGSIGCPGFLRARKKRYSAAHHQ